MTQASQTTAAAEEPAVLRLTRRFAASRETVFGAFTDAEVFKRWWGPKGFSCPVAELDVRPGGRYHVEMLSPDGNTFVIEGEFREVAPPARLVYSWAWQEGDFAGVETLVTLEFHDRGGETELELTHEKLPGERARAMHGHGWSGAFDCLDEVIAKGDAS